MNGHDATWVDDAVAVTLTAQRGTPWIMLRHYNPNKPDVSGFKRRPSTYRQHWDSMARFRRYSRESAESGVSGVSGRS